MDTPSTHTQDEDQVLNELPQVLYDPNSKEIINYMIIHFEYIEKSSQRRIFGRDLLKKKEKITEQIGNRTTQRLVQYYPRISVDKSTANSVTPDVHLIKKFLAFNTIKRLKIEREFYKKDMPPQKLEIIYPSWKKAFLCTVKMIISTQSQDCFKGFSGESRKVCDGCLAFKDAGYHRARQICFRRSPLYPKGTFKLKCECLFCHKKKTELGLVRPKSYFQFHKTKITHPNNLSIANKFNICFEARRWNNESNVRKYRKLQNGCYIPDWKYFWQLFTDQDPEYGEIIQWREDIIESQTHFSKESFLTIRYDEEL